MMESKHEKELKQEEPKFEKTVFCDHEVRVRIVCIEGKKYKLINATDLTNASDGKKKFWSDYIQNKGKKLFLEKLSSTLGIPRVQLVQSVEGNRADRGTWIHPKVAINFAEWISHDFAIKVTDWVDRIITKDLTLAKEIIDGHGPVKNEEEKELVSNMEAKLHSLKEEYEEKLREQQGIIKKKDVEIFDLREQVALMRKNQEEMIAQNKALLQTTTETLRETQDANDKLDDMKDNIRANAPFRAHRPANANKREVMIISRTRDNGPIPWHYYISCVKKDGMVAARKRAKGAFPNCEEIRVIEYVPNARHMLEELNRLLRKQGTIWVEMFIADLLAFVFWCR
jgi:hypothetical protein